MSPPSPLDRDTAGECTPPRDTDPVPVVERSRNDEAAADTPANALDSRALLQGSKAVTIAHNGALYRLQSTRLGKLILTK